jgi:hypothetical protein
MNLRKLLMIMGVSLLVYYVARQVQIRNNYVENLTEDRKLSSDETGEILTYYRSIVANEPVDPSKLSNNAKAFINSATAHPFTVLTDNIIHVMGKNSPGGMNRSEANLFIITYILDFITNYQRKFEKSNSNLTRDTFVKEAEELIKENKMYMFNIQDTQLIIDQNFESQPAFARDRLRELFRPVRDAYVAVWGDKLLIRNADGTNSINMSGPLQTILIDLTYAYLYPTRDVFTWVLSLFSGKN